MALNTVSSERLSTNVKTSNLGTELSKKLGQNKNLIINGAMQVAQRGTSSTANTYGSVDRIRISTTGTDAAPTHSQADVVAGTTPYTLGFRKAFKVTNGNQTSGAGADDAVSFVYTVEDQDLATSGWNHKSSSSKITISFWVKSSVEQNFYFTIQSDNGSQYRYVMETGTLTADTWTKITKTIPGNTNLVFNNDNGVGVFIVWSIFQGTNRTGTRPLNAWAALDNTSRTPDQTATWYTTNNSTWEITGVQLEVGSVATDFEHRSFTEELQLCKRYFQAQRPYYNAAQYLITNEVASNTVFFNPEMRATPTATHGSLQCRENTDSFANVTVSSNYLLDSKGINYAVTKSGASTSDSFIIFVNNAEYDAEL